MSTIGFDQHDHAACVADGVAAVEQRCKDARLQLTPVRRRVLEILLSEHRAMGAYEILDVLREEGLGSQPPVAYRALDFLVKNTFAHKIEQLNAFIACTHPDTPHAPAFLICRLCKTVAEAKAAPEMGGSADKILADTAARAGFRVERVVVEAQGVCPNCQDTDAV